MKCYAARKEEDTHQKPRTPPMEPANSFPWTPKHRPRRLDTLRLHLLAKGIYTIYLDLVLREFHRLRSTLQDQETLEFGSGSLVGAPGVKWTLPVGACSIFMLEGSGKATSVRKVHDPCDKHAYLRPPDPAHKLRQDLSSACQTPV